MRFEDGQAPEFARRCEKKEEEVETVCTLGGKRVSPIAEPVLQISGLLARTHFVSERQFIDVTDNTMMMMIAFIIHDEFVQWDDKTDRRTSLSSVYV